MICKKCGAQVPEKATECPNCHTPVKRNMVLAALSKVAHEIQKGTIQKNIKEGKINIPVAVASLIAVIAQFCRFTRWKCMVIAIALLRLKILDGQGLWFS